MIIHLADPPMKTRCGKALALRWWVMDKSAATCRKCLRIGQVIKVDRKKSHAGLRRWKRFVRVNSVEKDTDEELVYHCELRTSASFAFCDVLIESTEVERVGLRRALAVALHADKVVISRNFTEIIGSDRENR